MGRILLFSPTTPAGRPSLSVSFARMLPQGVTVASVESLCIVHPDCTVPDSSAAERLEDIAVVQSDGKTVSQFFSGGVAGVDYIITFIATYSDAEIEPVDAVLSVREYINVAA